MTMTITNIPLYTAIALKSGLELYAKHGIKPNRAWTPTAMLRKASELTGQKFKRGQYVAAIEALQNLLARAYENGERLN